MNPRQPQSDWNTITLVAGLLRDKLIAPFAVDVPITRVAFLVHLEQCLALSLKRGDTVIFSKLSGHIGVAVLRAIEASCAKLLYLPNCSPDLNPIEQAVS